MLNCTIYKNICTFRQYIYPFAEQGYTFIIYQTKYLFCLGSPLPAYLISRKNVGHLLPHLRQITRMFNIFNPFDSVAYRLGNNNYICLSVKIAKVSEPLFHQNYRLIRPVRIPEDIALQNSPPVDLVFERQDADGSSSA